MTTTVVAARDTYWDVVVVGTGVGGGTAGFALARGGRSVLFLDKGRARSATTLSGGYAEELVRPAASAGELDPGHLAAAGREWNPLDDKTNGLKTFVPFTGAGVGGSSALYGMALERFFPSDFSPRSNFRTVGDSTLPERWPVTFEELLPYYGQAEVLFSLRGTRDPTHPSGAPLLEDPPALSAAGTELFGSLQKRGIHPYRLPVACRFIDDCAFCQGYLCARECKNDSERVCVTPALTKHGSSLLDSCQVVGISTKDDSVDAITCVRQGERFQVRGKIFVLAAGALGTPALLLRSASPAWPQGVANRSGQVGRNLMRHLIDLHAVSPTTREPFDSRRKELAFNDFYVHGGVKLGSVQSFGRLPPPAVIAAEMSARVYDGLGSIGVAALRSVMPLLKRMMARMTERRVLFAGIVEDLPYATNRVTVGDDARSRIHYEMKDEAKSRVTLHRRLVRDSFRAHSTRTIKQASNNARLAHACGTCRFGDDPQTSVLDKNNRCHDLANLYVVDASFFPSSGGTNPALTIAANALRVATHVLRSSR